MGFMDHLDGSKTHIPNIVLLKIGRGLIRCKEDVL